MKYTQKPCQEIKDKHLFIPIQTNVWVNTKSNKNGCKLKLKVGFMMDYTNMSIGETLKNRRIELGIKQEAIAEGMGVTVQTIYKWEKGTTEPKASQVSKLGKVLRLTEKEICQGKQEEFDLDEMEFVRRVGILMNEVPHTEMLFGMHKYIADKKGFLNMLASVSSYPYELFDEEEIRAKKQMLEWAENGSVTFKNEDEKAFFLKHLKHEIESLSNKES